MRYFKMAVRGDGDLCKAKIPAPAAVDTAGAFLLTLFKEKIMSKHHKNRMSESKGEIEK